MNVILLLKNLKPIFLKKSIGYSGVKTWSELPSELKHNGISLQRFKALLRDRPILVTIYSTMLHSGFGWVGGWVGGIWVVVMCVVGICVCLVCINF